MKNMKSTKTLTVAAIALMAAACSSKTTDTAATEAENAASEGALAATAIAVAPQGSWKLVSYRLDSATTEFGPADTYAITFNPENHAFGISTDCNSIGGEYAVVADTVRFADPLVTEMACPDNTVEQNMLRLVNDVGVYALCQGDTLTLTAPSAGTATFVKQN